MRFRTTYASPVGVVMVMPTITLACIVVNESSIVARTSTIQSNEEGGGNGSETGVALLQPVITHRSGPRRVASEPPRPVTTTLR